LPIYVARVPAAPFTHRFPRNFYVDRSHCPRPHASYLAALPSTRAISQTPVFYVAHPIRSIREQVVQRAIPIL